MVEGVNANGHASEMTTNCVRTQHRHLLSIASSVDSTLCDNFSV